MNYVIYENNEITIWFCSIDCEIHITDKTNKTTQITFEDFIRTIDTIPERSREWKKEIINTWADRFGFFGKAV